MIRCALWFGLWVVTLGFMSIDVEYTDGLHVKFNSWTDRKRRRKP